MSISKTGKWLGRLSAALLTCSASTASAGDPCPISFGIYDLRSPAGLIHEDLLSDLQSQQASLGVTYRYTDSGLRIDSLHPDGAFAEAGLAARMTLTQIDGTPTTDVATTEALLDALMPGQIIRVEAARYGAPAQPFVVTIRGRDPVPIAAIAALQSQDCRHAELRDTTPENVDTLIGLISDGDALHCTDAHLRVVRADVEISTDALLFLRNQSHVMVVLPGWNTRCLPTAALDGNTLTQDNLLAALDGVIWDYVGERFSTP